ncbi:MAG: TetR/AcrR family transcriptional regulator [Acidimicrobiales bacterium]
MSEATLDGYRHGKVPRDVRRRHVLDLASALFAEKGYSAASMDELARRAGVSKPVIYELVGNKEELFRRCMHQAADELAVRVTTAVNGVEGPRESMLAGIEAWFSFIAQHRGIWDGLLSGEDLPVSREVAAMRRQQARVVARLLSGTPGDADTGAPSAVFGALAHVVTGACESLAIWWREHPEMSPADLAELCTTVLYPGLSVLAGLTP